MLYLVRMDVHLPADLSAAEAEDVKQREKSYSQALQRDGRWRELWRVVGEYANYSVFDVAGNDELHEILSGLPLFPYMAITVIPLAAHPSRIDVPGSGHVHIE
ncbi:MAG TPA: muconolactone Delta-isomerase [Microbacteriaceae bacterium]|nr:muconolactone Delta-isomerase [Microbacteriaceae bacterium]